MYLICTSFIPSCNTHSKCYLRGTPTGIEYSATDVGSNIHTVIPTL